MIRQTLKATQDATFSIDIPHPENRGMPTPRGTGFFVSTDGLFITAAHVVADKEGNPLPDLEKSWLKRESRDWPPFLGQVDHPTLEYLDMAHDFALLRCDFEKNRTKTVLKDRDGFPHITVGVKPLEEGEPVYAYGYPLSEAFSRETPDGIVVGGTIMRPRVTSAIVASTIEGRGMVSTPNDVQKYVLDKALNYGNSGGPIVAVDTGHAHAFCSSFQPVQIPQSHLRNTDGKPLSIVVPSLYGVVVSLASPKILSVLRDAGADIAGQSAEIAQEAVG